MKKSRNYNQRLQPRKQAANQSLLIVSAAALVCLVVVGIFGTYLLNSSHNNSNGTASSTDSQSLNPSDNTHQSNNNSSSEPFGKLEGATETTDEHGIIHGTTTDGINYTVHGRGEAALNSDIVRLAAVGDQIATDNSMPIAERYGGGSGSQIYDFTPFYQDIAPAIQEYDLRFINQETVMAGNENGYYYDGYPMFNSPDSCADAIAAAQFNLVNFASNHSYDMGTYGIERSHQIWDQYPELIIGGSYMSEEERETVQMIERNGMTFAFLAYTYGDNSYASASAMPNTYYCTAFDKDKMTEDITRAQKVADVIIVGMHWGSEYVSAPNDQQYEYARFLADLNVDLVIGTHNHIMQPVQYITGDTGNTIPVVFGLGDFISGWTLTDTILSGMFTCDFVRNTDGTIDVTNLAWYPLIEWSNGGNVWVRFLKDMDEATINANTRTDDVSNDYTYLVNKVNSVGMEIPVIM